MATCGEIWAKLRQFFCAKELKFVDLQIIFENNDITTDDETNFFDYSVIGCHGYIIYNERRVALGCGGRRKSQRVSSISARRL